MSNLAFLSGSLWKELENNRKDWKENKGEERDTHQPHPWCGVVGVPHSAACLFLLCEHSGRWVATILEGSCQAKELCSPLSPAQRTLTQREWERKGGGRAAKRETTLTVICWCLQSFSSQAHQPSSGYRGLLVMHLSLTPIRVMSWNR